MNSFSMPIFSRWTWMALAGASLLVFGCAVGPNYKRPNIAAPATFRGAPEQAQQASFADLPWWQIFHDETLTELIKTALTNNHDLEAAVARVEQARQVDAQTRSQYFPSFSYMTSTSYGHNQFIYSPSSNMRGAQGSFLGIVRATWEADLWGRIRRTNEASRAQFLASEEGRRGVMLTLVGDVSQAYFELIGLRRQLAIAKESAQSFTVTLQLVTQRMHEGIGSELQTSRAATDLANASATIPELERLIALKENQISVLLGRNPGPIATNAGDLPDVPLDVPAGLPAALLERRPDVVAAEQSMRSANAQIGVAQAAFFPTISPSVFGGKLAFPLSNFSLGMSNAWSIGAGVSGPIFTSGALTAQKRQAVAAWQQTRAQYLQTALSAFRDVSDAYISREKIDAARAEQSKVVQASEEAVRLMTERFTNGQVGSLPVLETKQQLYSAELTLTQTEVSRRLIVVQLYKALGGGWNLTDAQWIAANTQPTSQSAPPAK